MSTEDQADRDEDIARRTANVLLRLMNGVTPDVAFNVVGFMTVAVFVKVDFFNPADAVIEFDNWAAYTRQIIVDQIKEQLQ